MRSQGRTKDYWDFKDERKESFEDSLFQYPAMMVPAMQRQVIAAILTARPQIRLIADPFLGSGTILVQAMLAGRAFVGQDINPLALLVAKTRAFCLDHAALEHAVERVRARVAADQRIEYDCQFFNQSKWFTRGASIGLSRLRRAIRTERHRTVRLFLWTCLAETVRNNSNSRTSTFKLHVRPETEQNATTEQVVTYYFATALENLAKVKTFVESLRKEGHLGDDTKYRFPIKIVYGDSATTLPSPPREVSTSYDLVVTSPPYGDNRTTVPYGQAAWLPLQWIDLADIDPLIPATVITSMYHIDGQSLGGRRTRNRAVQEAVRKFGPATNTMVETLSKKEGDGLSRFVHFTQDIGKAISTLAQHCGRETYLIWTLGHRMIHGIPCPLTDIVAEIFAHSQIHEIARIRRRIPTKRIPTKNSISRTINEEFILLLQARGLPPTP